MPVYLEAAAVWTCCVVQSAAVSAVYYMGVGLVGISKEFYLFDLY